MPTHRLFLTAVLAAAALLLSTSTATGDEPPVFGITFSGFVKTDYILDSRQTVNVREGHFLLYPAPELKDRNGEDVNAQANFNILSIQSRLAGKITGPDAFGAKTSGLLEGEFFGTSDADVSGFRVRHAFLKLDWESTSLLLGQYWHPMFVTDVIPGVVSFNTGAPFQPFSRNPQVRLTHTLGGVRLIAAALAQRDFPSTGPSGFSSSYLRNAVLPDLHGQVQVSDGGVVAGAGADYKVLRPRLVTTRNVSTRKTVGSAAVFGYVKLPLEPILLKAEATWGGNLADMLMLGGYAVSRVDTATGVEEYTELRSLSVWGEISGGKEVEFGLFGGYAKNLGAGENLAGATYGRGTDIDNLVRISPRVVWNSGKVRLASELEYTTAAYGTPNPLNKGKVENTTRITNIRLLLAAFYFF